jgi:hypothetical protein
MAQELGSDLSSAIPELLARRPGGARFVMELRETLPDGAGAGDLEQALTRLERNGLILIRDHACADPHLEGVDLRVAALVDQKNT